MDPTSLLWGPAPVPIEAKASSRSLSSARARKGCWKKFYCSVTYLHFHLFQPVISISFSCWYHEALQPFTDQLWVFILFEVDSNSKQFLKELQQIRTVACLLMKF